MKRIFFIIAALAFLCGHAFAAQTIEAAASIGGATNASCTTGSGISANTTTTGTNEIIVALVFANATNATGSAPNITAIANSSNPITWTRVGQANWHSSDTGTPYVQVTMFWALAPTAQAYTGFSATNGGGTIDNCATVSFAIKGNNTTSPLDTNAGIPFTNGGAGSGIPTVASVSTTCDKTLIVQLAADANTAGQPPVQTNGTGYTMLASQTSSSGTNFSKTAGQYQVFAAAQSGISVAFGTSWSSNISLVAAFKDATASCGSVAKQKNLLLLGVQ